MFVHVVFKFTMSKVPQLCVSITQVFTCIFHVYNGQSPTNMCEHITGVCICIFHVYNEQSPTNMCEYNTGVYMYFSCL